MVVDVLAPMSTRDHHFRSGVKCTSWIPIPVVSRLYAAADDEFDPDEYVRTRKALAALITAASEALYSILPIAGLPKTKEPVSEEFWFDAVHFLMDTETNTALRDGRKVRVMDISIASELAINRILEATDGPPIEIVGSLTPQRARIFRYLWDKRTVSCDAFSREIWGKGVQSGSIDRAIDRLNDDLLKYDYRVDHKNGTVSLVELENPF